MPEQMKRVKKLPMRKCVVTNEQHVKSEMIRIVRTPEGEVVIDETGKTRGHGAYIVKKKQAVLQAQKKRILQQHLEVEIDDSLFDKLLELVK